jgi:hypothetical protein
VCGRTLLRGERAEVYLNGGARRSVCELCKDRAIHEGWIREGTVPAYTDSDTGFERRRSLLGRLRARRDAGTATGVNPTLDDDLDGRSWSESRQSRRSESDRRDRDRDRDRDRHRGRERNDDRRADRDRDRDGDRRSDPTREPRHVRAVPTSAVQKVVSAVDLFNGSEHPRTVAGVARSLGAPTVSVAPSTARASLVTVVVSWELCWYRYEVDLSDDQPSVRVAGQGYELDELTPEELQPNAVADDRGALSL